VRYHEHSRVSITYILDIFTVTLTKFASTDSNTTGRSSSNPLSCVSLDANVNGARSSLSIIWSCIATIFACTWIAVHPNVPSLDDLYWRKLMRHARIFIVALLAPEFIVTWAIHQWLAVRVVVEEVKCSCVERTY
jgi:hypothetical protein